MASEGLRAGPEGAGAGVRLRILNRAVINCLSGQPARQARRSQNLPQHHHPAIRRQQTAIKGGTDFSARTGWQSEHG